MASRSSRALRAAKHQDATHEAAAPAHDDVDADLGAEMMSETWARHDERAIPRPSGSGAPLDPGIRRDVERATGAEVGDVRVHTGAEAAASAAAIDARAFTTGNDIYLGAGETQRDPALMAHEVAHTVQQAGGDPGVQCKRVSEPGDAAELEADSVAAAVVSGERAPITRSTGVALHRKAGPGAASGPGLGVVRHAVETGQSERSIAGLVAQFLHERAAIMDYLTQTKGSAFAADVSMKITKANGDALLLRGEASELYEHSRAEWKAGLDALDPGALRAAAAKIESGWQQLVDAEHRLAPEPVDPAQRVAAIGEVERVKKALALLVGPTSYRSIHVGGNSHGHAESAAYVKVELHRAVEAVEVAKDCLALGEESVWTIAPRVASLDLHQVGFVRAVLSAQGKTELYHALDALTTLKQERHSLEKMKGVTPELIAQAKEDAGRIASEVKAMRATKGGPILGILDRYETPEERDALLQVLENRGLIDSMISRGGRSRVMAWIAGSDRYKEREYHASEDNSVQTWGEVAETSVKRLPAAYAYVTAGMWHGLEFIDPTGGAKMIGDTIDGAGDRVMKWAGADKEEIKQTRGIGHVTGEVEMVLATAGMSAEAKTVKATADFLAAALEIQNALRGVGKFIKLFQRVGPDVVAVIRAAATKDPRAGMAALNDGLDGLLDAFGAEAISETEAHEAHEGTERAIRGTRAAYEVGAAKKEVGRQRDADSVFKLSEAVEREKEGEPPPAGALKGIGRWLVKEIVEALAKAAVAALKTIKRSSLVHWNEAWTAGRLRELVVRVCGEAAAACSEPVMHMLVDLETRALMIALKEGVEILGINIDETPAVGALIQPQVKRLVGTVLSEVIPVKQFLEEQFKKAGEKAGAAVADLVMGRAEEGEQAKKEPEEPSLSNHGMWDWIDAATGPHPGAESE